MAGAGAGRGRGRWRRRGRRRGTFIWKPNDQAPQPVESSRGPSRLSRFWRPVDSQNHQPVGSRFSEPRIFYQKIVLFGQYRYYFVAARTWPRGYLMLLGGLVALWPTHNTTSHIRVRSFRPHQRPPRPGRSRAEHASASRPLQRPIRPSRARAPAELRSAASNIVQSWQPASRRQTRRARCPPTPLPSPRTSSPGECGAPKVF